MSTYDPADPDMLYLAIDKKKLLKEANPNYDAKKSCWAPDAEQGFLSAELQSTKGEEVTVKILDSNQMKTFKKDDVQSMNPPKFEKMEDIANMTYLNEASVLHNLRARYTSGLIYTYSGLFCIAINPYRRLPIYTPGIVDKYRGKRKTEMPPHLFSIADNAYQFMVQERENQSMLITGESGAGKTENTKKVIAYFAFVAAAAPSGKDDADKEQEKKGSLEDQIVQANPVLEAYGNAKTSRNNNSSRFGKFVRIHFASSGKIAGADIETYLLEKSRVTYQQSVERNYHIFYQILSGGVPNMQENILANADAGLYSFINQGVLTVNGINDVEEMKDTHSAFDVLGFSEDEKTSCYKCTGSILHMGEMKFKQKGEQAEPDGTAEAEKVAFLLGVNNGDFIKALCKPKIKVGADYVTQGRTKAQVVYSVSAMAKSLYDRVFNWLVKKVNQGLDTKKPRQFYIGVLDIAGFEIFDFNSFEQLCINYTNERLQQFFNHHMFVLEQEEYKKEGIEWVFIDFGMDLEACIELIEKPLGILSILEEECMFPKASDKTFKDKLTQNHMGKSPNFLKPSKSMKGGEHGDFALKHYAGTVPYNIGSWLEKNKDPINQTIIDLMKQSKEPLVSLLFSPPPEAEGAAGGKKKKKSSAFQTISSTHRESLNKLMKNLYCTHPHFVRCIIPNEVKTPGLIDAGLVLHQLQCNGVLEGIRICRKGFPSRLIYSEFKQRYSILAPNAIPEGFQEGKVVSGKILEALDLGQDEYRLGNTKVFFKAGVLGFLEEIRDERLSVVVALFQAHIRGYLMRKYKQNLHDKRTALEMIQKNIRKWLGMRNWAWWRFYTKVKPLLSIAAAEDDMKIKEQAMEKQKEELVKVSQRCKDLEEQSVVLMEAKNTMKVEVQLQQDTIDEYEERIELLLKDKEDSDMVYKEFEDKQKEDEATISMLKGKANQCDMQVGDLSTTISTLDAKVAKCEQDCKAKNAKIQTLTDERIQQDEELAKLVKIKADLEDVHKQTLNDLHCEEEKASHLNKLKNKLENTLDEFEDALEREKKVRADLEKAKRKVEQELHAAQDIVDDLEHVKTEMQESIKRKEKEIVKLNGLLEDEQHTNIQLQKKIKELTNMLEVSEQELEAEKQARGKVEKQRTELAREVEDMAERLDEAVDATAAQMEVNKKREQELGKLRREMEDTTMQQDAMIASMRKKNTEMSNEMGEQIDMLQKVKSRLEKDKMQLKIQMDEMQIEFEQSKKNKGSSDVMSKQIQSQFADLNAQLDDSSRQVTELQAHKNRLSTEVAELIRQLEEAERSLARTHKENVSLTGHLEESKHMMEEETRVRQKAQTELRHMSAEMESMRVLLEDETESRSSLQRQLSKANTEVMQWKAKYETEGSSRTEELEDAKRRLHAKLSEAEQNMEAAYVKCNGLDKAKARLQAEIEDLTVDVERADVLNINMEKKQRSFERTIQEWQSKVKDIQAELESAQKECRGYSAELFRLRSDMEESQSQMETIRKENKNLADEINDLHCQLTDDGHNVSEMEKAKKKLQLEKEELEAALIEAETALELEEAKIARVQQEMTISVADVERRISEKEEEVDTNRRNHQRNIDSIQSTLDTEIKSKSETVRIKKKLEQDINELEIAVDTAIRASSESESLAKKYSGQIKELEALVDEEQRYRDEAREASQSLERRCAMLKSDNDQIRNALDTAERARKSAEGDLMDAEFRLNEVNAQTTMFTSQKRKMEIEITTLQSDVEDARAEMKNAEDNYKRAITDASHLADELRAEQDHSRQTDKMRRTLDTQVTELQLRLDEVQAAQLKGGKAVLQKLEAKVRTLETGLEEEQRKHQDTTKLARLSERRLKEITFQEDEDRKNHERLQAINDKLNSKIKSLKTQIDEADEMSATYLNKYRRAQKEFEDAQERADSAEMALTNMRSRSRRSVSVARHVESSITMAQK